MWPLLAALALAAEPGPAEPNAPAAELRVQLDWQGHPAMHIPWTMFGRGLTDRPLTHRTWRHMFRQTVSEPALAASGIRVFLAAAMAAERARSPEQARRLVLKQLAYVEAFVAAHPDRYAVAKTPAELRALVATTDKLVFVHSIEGGEELLWQAGDAAFWADQGVALITLIHLRDEEFGGSALLPGTLGRLINPRGAREERRGERRGLTEHGAATIVALHDAGILVDFTHMSADARADALDVCEAHAIPPVFTHSALARALDDGRGLTDDQLVRVYRLGGQVSPGLSALDLAAPPSPDPAAPCPGTLEAWAWHEALVQHTLLDHVGEIFGDPALTPDTLTETQRTRLATGWSSDWNGWLSHSQPVYGRGGCRGAPPADALPIDTLGLAHPGLLPHHWQRVEERGVDLDPILRSSERFVQLWEEARGEREAGR